MVRRMRLRALLFAVVAAIGVAAGGSSPALSAHREAAVGAQRTNGNVAVCRVGYYENVNGHCVHRPSSDPVGATARCADGSYSYSEHASGTCSRHGGVARWIHHQ